MAGSHGRVLVVGFGRLAMSGERPQDGVETPVFERLLLRLHPGAARGRVGRDRRRGGGQVFADVIEINQVAALVAKPRLDLADDPGRAVADRVNPGVRPEAGANRAGKQLAPRLFDPALDRARINRRAVPLRMRQRQLRLPPGQSFALALVLRLAARLDDRNHAAVRLDDDRLANARRFRELQIPAAAFMHRLGVGERDPLARALADREAVMLVQLGARLREGLIGGEVDDGPLQWPRTPERAHLRPQHEGTHPLRPEPILRLPNLYFTELRVPAEFFSPWRCIRGRWRISRSVAATRRSAQERNASRPRRRVSSTIRSSAASASFNSPPSPSTASTIDDTRFRSSGCARNAATSPSSLNSPTAIRSPPAESLNPTYPASV